MTAVRAIGPTPVKADRRDACACLGQCAGATRRSRATGASSSASLTGSGDRATRRRIGRQGATIPSILLTTRIAASGLGSVARTSWVSSTTSRSASATTSPAREADLEPSARRQEGELVVRLTKANRERTYAAPENLVGEVLVQKEQVVEGVLRDDEEAAALVSACVRRARGL